MKREIHLQQVSQLAAPLDMVIIGGGATGASVALDAAARGFQVALLEQYDFGKGTSSRSTKLVHGGVRYLAQGNVSLVRGALRERALLRNNAPHVVREMSFIVPCAGFFERIWYAIGFKIYDLLSGKGSFSPAQSLSKQECLRLAPTLKPTRVQGGIRYSDGQFDDSRLLLNIVQSASEHGAIVLNYAPVQQVLKDGSGRACGVCFVDSETGQEYSVQARCVINATGPFCDAIRSMDQPNCEPLVAASQGVHLVLPARFLPGQAAIIVPKTSDGRVIFMIPWHGHVVVGTTDTPIQSTPAEPHALPEEIDFLLDTAGQYLTCQPTRDDVLSTFVGIRPLVGKKSGTRTSQLSRDHVIVASDSGMITITGGKWTTARKMGEDCVDHAIRLAGLPQLGCKTKQLALHGAGATQLDGQWDNVYGCDGSLIEQLAKSDVRLQARLHPDYEIRGAEVVWAVRHEMARTVEDVLARRTRLLFLNASVALQVAPQVAEWIAHELGLDQAWIDKQIKLFQALAKSYQIGNL